MDNEVKFLKELECAVGIVAEQIRNCSTDKGKVR